MKYVGARRLGFRRVLVVDDHEPSRVVMCYWLELRGHACLTTADATDAFAAFEDFAPDVVIFASHPRRNSVVDLAARFRALAGTSARQLQIIVVSAFSEHIDDRTSESIDAYLVKPIDMRALMHLLSEDRTARGGDPADRHRDQNDQLGTVQEGKPVRIDAGPPPCAKS